MLTVYTLLNHYRLQPCLKCCSSEHHLAPAKTGTFHSPLSPPTAGSAKSAVNSKPTSRSNAKTSSNEKRPRPNPTRTSPKNRTPSTPKSSAVNDKANETVPYHTPVITEIPPIPLPATRLRPWVGRAPRLSRRAPRPTHAFQLCNTPLSSILRLAGEKLSAGQGPSHSVVLGSLVFLDLWTLSFQS
jgi:hypothetical protein